MDLDLKSTVSRNASIEVLICTHNRSSLLRRTLDSLNAATRPIGTSVNLLVIANHCSDDTENILRAYQGEMVQRAWLPLRWEREPIPGKSRALNRAIPLLTGDVIAMVDDDHRVDRNYFVNISNAVSTYRDKKFFCGRILPDWNGSEPTWVHDKGEYRIYPLPIPRFDQGPDPKVLSSDTATPGGGNLFLHRAVFSIVGEFDTTLGPVGHNLGGAEDIEWVRRARDLGLTINYVPSVVQYHFVDPQRLKLGYLLRKAFERSSSAVQVSLSYDETDGIPKYMVPKVLGYLFRATFTPLSRCRRFYLVRLAAALGELKGFAKLRAIRVRATKRKDFSFAGPRIGEMGKVHRAYVVWAVTRLCLYALLVTGFLSALGVYVYGTYCIISGSSFQLAAAGASATASLIILTVLQFLAHLFHIPSSVAASCPYRMSRFHAIWRRLTAGRIRWIYLTLGTLAAVLTFWALTRLALSEQWFQLALFAIAGATMVTILIWVFYFPEPRASKADRLESANTDRPNVVLIGCDTLRADRVSNPNYPRTLTRNIDELFQRGTLFSNCYVPLARTAPSLVSYLTGMWPQSHGIRDNFVSDAQAKVELPSVPKRLQKAGYHTVAIGDWAASDLGKFSLGFAEVHVPDDQWNIKYLIRQGPKHIRLFLSLFTHNRFGKTFLPELYYLAGVPLTSHLGRMTRKRIGELNKSRNPFMINLFLGTTHPPFGSEYPFYTLYSDPKYAGESKYLMSKLTDPMEIIRTQQEPKEAFDLDQIIALYDGCVRNFDQEVGRIVSYLEKCDLDKNTIVIIYSDHGMEFFEHDTWGQGNSAQGDFSARVPLVIVDPRRKGHGRLHQTVRSVDLAPTLLELLGLPVIPEADGQSLGPILRDPHFDPQLPAYFETGIWLTNPPGFHPEHLHYPDILELLEVGDPKTGTLSVKQKYQEIVVRAKDRMVRVGRWMLVYMPLQEGALYKLFDVEKDPRFKHDVSSEFPEVTANLKDAMRYWIAKDMKTGQGEIKDPFDREEYSKVI
ncbi:MAG: sulfatase-like hydrolase/transferase [Gammaproteobacteria bacterium]|nr:sulfatase-like hydrolase/transferase [Gammaproteobacteria bacterium]